MNTPQKPPQPRIRLAEARNQRGLSQQALADDIATTYVNVSRWERGITRPSPYFRRKLATYFGKTEEQLDLLPGSIVDGQGKAGLQSKLPVTTSLMPSVVPVALYDPAIPLQPATRLVGREQDLAKIRERLCAGGSVALTALNGLPGVGKTALTIALAHDPDIRAHFRDGILWAGLGPTPNMPGILSRWGSLLGISSSQMERLTNNELWGKAIQAAIGTRSMLLVIDDAWKLEEALTFKVGGANCAHLVTTRFPNLASYMSVDGATMLKELNEEASVALLGLLAPQVVSREMQRVRDLVQAVGGLPLALTLIGNYLRKQAYSGPARRISAALERLSIAEERLQISEPHAPVERHPSLPFEASLSLQSIIAVTDQLLSEPARATLYALSVFPPKPNTFSEEAALVVAACSIDDLDALIDAGLLESNGTDRYMLHQVIADYAHVHLQESAPHERLIAYIIDYVEAHKKDYEMLELESSVILATLEVAYEQNKHTSLVRMVCAFAPFLILRGFYAQAERHLKRAYETAIKLGDIHGITGTLLYLGEVSQKQGNYMQAEASLQEGLELARNSDDRERICALLNDLGNVSWRKGDYVQAEGYLQEGLTLARRIEDNERIYSLLKILGSVVGSRGDFAKSKKYLQEGLTLARQIGDREQVCFLLSNLGVTAGGQGYYAQAEEYFQEGLVLARQIGHREQTCILLINLGEVATAQDNYSQAEEYFREGLVLARQIGQREWISALLINLGLMTRKLGNFLQTEVYLQESLDLARQLGRPHIISAALYEYGDLYLEQNKIDAAKLIFEEMLITLPERDQELLSLAQYGLARVAAVQGNIDEARKLGGISVVTLEDIGHRKVQEVKEWLASVKN